MNSSIVNAVNQIIVIVGFPSIVGGLIYIGRKLQILDDLRKSSERFEDFSKCATAAIIEMQTHLSSSGFIINQRLAYTAQSPLKLTDFGKTLLRESGFEKTIANPEKLKYLIDLVKSKNPQTNYDIQDSSMKIMAELAEKNDSIAKPLKEYSFNKGLPLEIVLNSAGIMLRDEAMKEIKFDDKY